MKGDITTYDITAGNFGVSEYTFRLEALPFGVLQSKGEYAASATKRNVNPS